MKKRTILLGMACLLVAGLTAQTPPPHSSGLRWGARLGLSRTHWSHPVEEGLFQPVRGFILGGHLDWRPDRREPLLLTAGLSFEQKGTGSDLAGHSLHTRQILLSAGIKADLEAFFFGLECYGGPLLFFREEGAPGPLLSDGLPAWETGLSLSAGVHLLGRYTVDLVYSHSLNNLYQSEDTPNRWLSRGSGRFANRMVGLRLGVVGIFN